MRRARVEGRPSTATDRAPNLPIGARQRAPDQQLWRGLLEALLPCQDRVVDFDRPRADLDRPLHALRFDTCIDVPALAVQRLGSRIVDAHAETQSIKATSARLALGTGSKRGANTASPVLRPDHHILKFRCIGQREVRVGEWLSIPPSDEINPVALVEARQAEDSRDRLKLTGIERMDLVLHAHIVPEERVGKRRRQIWRAGG